MPMEVGVWRIDQGSKPVSLGGMDYESRLQQILADDLSIVDPNLLLIGREVESRYGGRIDLLAIDADGALVAIELKRDRTPREVVAQILDYGSWIRHLTSQEVADIFINYQNRFLAVDVAKSIDSAFHDRFHRIPEELNTSHRLVIVAGELDSSTERIVSYLREEHEVDINIAFFRAFKDDGREYLTRAWLESPADIAENVPASGSSPKGQWNGEYYVSFGEGDHRRWSDAKKYGFIGGGGGPWYVRTLYLLQPGSRIWVSVPGRGYVGVGEVASGVARYDEFTMNDPERGTIPITKLELDATDAFDERHGEHFIAVNWIKTVEFQDAVRERGFFGNQNTVARPRDPKWNFTVERLKTIWGVR